MEVCSKTGTELLALQAFDFTWVTGLAAFGVHLVLIGRLLIVSRNAPSVLGRLLITAGTTYALDTVAHIALASYETYSECSSPSSPCPPSSQR